MLEKFLTPLCAGAYAAGMQLKMLFFPRRCASCNHLLPTPAVVCQPCSTKVRPIVSHTLRVSGSVTVQVYALSAYIDPIKSLICAKRRSDIIAGHELAHLMWEHMPIVRTLPVDVFVPIPLHWRRYAQRGFNQAEEMARFLAQQRGVVCANVLRRSRHTQFQAELSREKRAQNVSDVFQLIGDHAEFAGKHLVLVDDLFTTGSTVREAVRELITLKPASVSVVVAARAV